MAAVGELCADLHGDGGSVSSVRVEVTLGRSTWRTSLFPSKPLDTYVLPVKKAVRRAEQLDVDDTATFNIRVLG